MLPLGRDAAGFRGGAGGEAAAPERSLAMPWPTAMAWPRGAWPLDAGGWAREREAIYISRHISNPEISKCSQPSKSPSPYSNHPKSLNNLI